MENQRSDFFLYNIIKFEEPNVIFIYAMLLFLFIYLSIKINFTVSLLIALIIYTVIIYYFYIYRNQNYLYESEKNTVKFNNINDTDNHLKNFPKIIDLLYYFEDIKINNIESHQQLIDLLTQFTIMYNSCKIDYSLIDSLYRNMVYIRTKILVILNSFIYNVYSTQENKNIINSKNNLKKIINDMLDEIVLLYRKKFYYNGYNNLSSIINTSNVLPHNILLNTNPVNRNDTPKMEGLLVW